MSVPAYWSPGYDEVRAITMPAQGRISGNEAENKLRREFLEQHLNEIQTIEDVQNWLRVLLETV